METATPQKQQSQATIKNCPAAVKGWLLIGLIMVFGQVVIGGITRLTGSGLSITKWEIVTGTLPPLNELQWEEAFTLYKQTPQYQKINKGMSMTAFQFIYFWEYFHRLWARTMGIVFIVPFLIFWRKGWIDKPLMNRLGMIVLLAAIAASFGWIMVASGLVNRPWVNAYKLTMHLSLGFILFAYLLWTVFKVFYPQLHSSGNFALYRWSIGLTAAVGIQIILGGIMSGTKAALAYPTFPDMQGEWIPDILLHSTHWQLENFVQYDATPFMVALVQLLHRSMAYIVTIWAGWFFFKVIKSATNPMVTFGLYLLLGILALQVTLGILTLLNSVGSIPVGFGVLHQAGGLLLLGACLFLNYQLKPVKH